MTTFSLFTEPKAPTWPGEEGRYVRVSVSTRVLRTIDKIGLMATLKKHKLSLKDLVSGPKTAKKVATPKAATPKTVAAKSA